MGGRRDNNRKRGVVDRVTDGVVVVVVEHPDDPNCQMEVYIPENDFERTTPNEGDRVSVTIKNKKKR